MKRSSGLKAKSLKSEKAAAFLWDESFLWGLMACKALRASGLSFDLIRSEDIRNGSLDNYKLLLVPGGWASNKLKALRGSGVGKIRDFVSGGGSYIGFCGGAGLATLDGIGLLNIKRKPAKERLPSFSGRISIDINDHPIWDGFTKIPPFYAWWPSQFLIHSDVPPENQGFLETQEYINILARFNEAMPDAFSSDLNVGDIEGSCGWSELESLYKINLDPKRLRGEPAVVEGFYGDGKVILSLLHFDTPGDIDGSLILRNLWRYLLGPGPLSGTRHGLTEIKKGEESGTPQVSPKNQGFLVVQSDYQALMPEVNKAMDAVSGLIRLGLRNFLWFWRTPMILQWRRGIRGFEYCTLYVMIKEISEMLKNGSSLMHNEPGATPLMEHISRINEILLPFTKKAERLLTLERCALQSSHINYESCDDPEIMGLRRELFSTSKSHGGMFKTIIDEIDSLLYSLLATGLYVAPSH